MTRLTLRLFGPGTLTVGASVVRTHSARTFALLAYLVVEPSRPHARSRLAELLWQGVAEASSRQGLRQALYSLRMLGDGQLGDCLQVGSDWVRFVPPAADAAVDIDVTRFLAAVGSTDEALWREAATAYTAPFLDGRRLASSALYETWLCAARERLHALAMHNLGRLAACHAARSEWAESAGFAEAMRDLDPTSEAASQYLLRIYAATNQLQAADDEWTRLSRLLWQEFGIEPSTETADLYRALRPRSAAHRKPDAAMPGRGAGRRGDTAAPLSCSDVESIVRAGQAAERVHAFSQAADLYDRALKMMALPGLAAPARRADVLLLHEAVLERLGRRADQELAIAEALSIAQSQDDADRVATVLLRRAGACAYLGRHAEARSAAEGALRICRDRGDLPGQAEALRELGFVHWHAEDYGAALQHARDALALHRQMGDLAGEATALHNLAEIHRDLGSPRQAVQWFEQALQLHWAARNPAGEILSLFGWAHALRQCGDHDGSTQKYESALKLSEQNGERAMHSRALHALAMQHAALGALDMALAHMRRAIEVDRAIGYAHALGHDLVELSTIHVLRGEISQARVALQEAQVWFGFTEDADALAATRSALLELDSNAGTLPARGALRRGIKSHLPLSEGKVYCVFESPVARQLPG
jgi:DNA-binding SARP family transcriptional activator/Tfp pilus assembly protein PilF